MSAELARDPTSIAAAYGRRRGGSPAGLARIRALTDALGRPQQRYRCLQVTGTNGKTTTTRMLAEVLTAHGLRTGAYTSPHLQSATERIRIDDRPIAAPALRLGMDRVEAHLDGVEKRCGQTLTFFDVITGLGLAHFAEERVDTAVLEVGIGGRRDATNICDAGIAVIGRVARDHPELGGDVGAIAFEKAGIIAQGATVVVAPQAAPALRVIDAVARARGAVQLRAGSDFALVGRRRVGRSQQITVATPGGRVLTCRLGVPGRHHAGNAALALAAAEVHLGGLDETVVDGALAAFRAPGRTEVVRRRDHPDVWLDGAHNPAAATSLAREVAGAGGDQPTVLVLGVMADKDVEGIAGAIVPHVDAVVVVPPPGPRAAGAGRLAAAVRAHGVVPSVAPDMAAALRAAGGVAGPSGTVVVCGSIYLVGAARDALDLPVR